MRRICLFLMLMGVVIAFSITHSKVQAEALYSDDGNYIYEIFDEESNTGTITKYLGSETEVVIPDTIDGIRIVRIGDRAFASKSVTNVVIPDTVTWIGSSVFSFCGDLSSITIPDCVTRIGDNAFNHCTSLESVSLPNITGIPSNMFASCYSLQSVTIPKTVQHILNGAFLDCTSLQSIIIPKGVTIIQKDTFWDCKSLRNVTIPDTVSNIRDQAFRGCSSLQSIDLPNGLTRIGLAAFSGCTSLQNVILPESLEVLGGNAFVDCKSLVHVTIPGSITHWKNLEGNDNAYGQFENCYSLETVEIHKGITELPTRCFQRCESLETISIPDSVISIGSLCFSNCNSLENVSLPKSIIEVKSYAFSNCVKLKDVDFPNTVTAINNGTFLSCESLQNFSIPNSVTTIGSNSFENCISLQKITIPDNVSVIKNNAFSNNGILHEVILPNSLAIIEQEAFSDCKNLICITIPGSVSEMGERVFNNTPIDLMYGYAGTRAETYAHENNIAFSSLDFIKTSFKDSQLSNWEQLKNGNPISGNKFDAFSNLLLETESFVIPGMKMTHLKTCDRLDCYCTNMIPQGFCFADGYAIISAYCANGAHSSVLYILKNRRYLETISLMDEDGRPFCNHAGGLAFMNGNIYIAGSTKKCVYKVEFNTIKDRLGEQDGKSVTVRKAFNTEQTASFITSYQNLIYVGTYYQDANNHPTNNTTVCAYNPSNGSFDNDNKIELPTNTGQGIEFITIGHQDYIIVSASNGRNNTSNLYYIKWNGETNLTEDDIFKTVEMPNMSEDLCMSGNKLWIAFESAANKYLDGDTIRPINRVVCIDALAKLFCQEGTYLKANTSCNLEVQSFYNDEYEYKFIVFNSDTKQWYKIQDFSDKTTCKWNSGPIGVKNLYVDIRNKSNYSDSRRIALTDIYVTKKGLKITSFSSSEGDVLNAFSFTALIADADKGSSPYNYKFIVHNERTGQWYKIQDFSTSKSTIWYTSSPDEKTLYVDVKDKDGTVVRKGLPVTVC